MRRIFKEHGLSIVMFGLFLAFLFGAERDGASPTTRTNRITESSRSVISAI